MNLSLRNVLVFAPDLTIAQEFYGETLGLPLERADQDFLIFQSSTFTLSVFRCAHTREEGRYSDESGSSIAFSVPSLAEAVTRLRERDVTVLHDTPNEGPLGRYVAFADPFGTVHELIEPLT